jgi:hypothetical protein
MKGKIQENHIPKNSYELQIIGLPVITFIEVSDIPEELDVVDMPDRTKASGGNTKAGEFTAIAPSHHDVEVAAMEAWYKEGQDPVSATYKKAGVLIKKSLSGEVARTYTFTGLFVTGRTLQSLSLENEGELDAMEWAFSFDDIMPST